MSKSSSDPDFQKDIGALGDFSGPGIAFNAIRKSEYTTTNSVLPFDEATVNVGDAFDVRTGIFTAPTQGFYHFGFHSYSGGGSAYEASFYFYKNEVKLNQMMAHSYESFSTSFYEHLEANDTVYVKTGQRNIHLYDSSSSSITQFSGSLVF